MLLPEIKNLPFLLKEKPAIAMGFLGCVRKMKECDHVCLPSWRQL